jgi:precorrin-3B synthase
MNARETLRRGACPGLSSPMQTGDGLLARLTPAGATISLHQFAGLWAAAQAHGNGIVEVTSRGSIQVRGLREATAPLFAADVAALAIEASDAIPVLIDPVSDNQALAAEIRAALAGLAVPGLSAKLSVVIDLDPLAADISLRTIDGDYVHAALAGSPLGAFARRHVADSVRRLFEALAAKAPGSRMRDTIERGGIEGFKARVAGRLIDVPSPAPRLPSDPIGVHHLPSGIALGIGLPFGHSDAATLARLIDAVRQAGASGFRTAPGRALLVMGLPSNAAPAVTTAVKALGFIVDLADPRRRIVACAGAPICASGQIPARALAPLLADAATNLSAGGVIHLSGCAKGCAHPQPAQVAVVGCAGLCDIAVDGVSAGSVAPEALPQRLAAILRGGGGSP